MKLQYILDAKTSLEEEINARKDKAKIGRATREHKSIFYGESKSVSALSLPELKQLLINLKIQLNTIKEAKETLSAQEAQAKDPGTKKGFMQKLTGTFKDALKAIKEAFKQKKTHETATLNEIAKIEKQIYKEELRISANVHLKTTDKIDMFLERVLELNPGEVLGGKKTRQNKQKYQKKYTKRRNKKIYRKKTQKYFKNKRKRNTKRCR